MKLLILLLSINLHASPDQFGLTDVYTKLVNNTGNGFERLYGVRNFRVVIPNILYRSGANNVYNKYGKRDNSNPLPTIALENLEKEGFTTAIYLYTTNYSSAPHQIKNLKYIQLSVLNPKNEKPFLKLVYDRLEHLSSGYVDAACWNGWHASGFASAIALMQFCGFTNREALQYWIKNTDGDSNYPNIKTKILNFKPFPELGLNKRNECF